jgi:transcription termination factor Rho
VTERSSDVDSAPFGAMDRPESNPDKTAKPSDEKSKGEGGGPMKKDWRKERRGKATGDKSQSEGKKRRRSRSRKPGTESADEQSGKVVEQEGEKPKKAEGRNQVRKKRPSRDANQGSGKQVTGKAGGSREKKKREGSTEKIESLGTTEGLILIDKQHHGTLRATDMGWLKTNQDVHVSPRLVQKFKLYEGSVVTGPYARSRGSNHKFDLLDVETIDGFPAGKVPKVRPFKQCLSISPDFHYNVGDLSSDLSLRVIDLLCPVGRGTRGLLVAPPRSGKTMILQSFAKAVEEHFPDCHLMVLLVDERPEEATDWKRSINPKSVFVSNNDETAKKHTQLCEAVFKRAKRLVEIGEEVILLVDSLTRMGRAYNNVSGNSGKTMSGGIDSRALEIPKQFFGLARNTESAGSLTILATALIETGSVMDKVIFEEFKGTGNMELVLSRKLADRRIFPAIDVERSGTRKEERLFSSAKLRQMHILRRVLTSMHFAEAMELLVTKLDEVDTNAAFLKRFEVAADA